MRNIINSKISESVLWVITAVLALAPTPAMAVGVLGEYSFLHVTFNSVWHLFLFIFVLVMIPFALIIFTSWRFRHIKEDETSGDAAGKATPREERKE